MMPEKPEANAEGNPNEPAEIRGLNKKELHEYMHETWHLPPYNARGVTRAYLVQVYTGRVFRVNDVELKQFLANLTKKMVKKVPFINSTDVKAKVEMILQELGLPPLGYPPNIIPDETWLLNVARYVDRSNIAAIFKKDIPNSDPLDITTTRMKTAKVNCEQYLLRGDGLLSHPEVFHAVTNIFQSHKRLNNKNAEVQALQARLQLATRQLQEERVHLQSYLETAATTVYRRGTGDTESVMQEGANFSQKRAQIKYAEKL